jgi:hypothetical protein
MSRVGIASRNQWERHGRFVAALGAMTRYAPGNRASDGGPGKWRHRSERVGGKGK